MKNLLSFLLICLPLWAIAQDKPAKVRYDPGKWYVGLRAEGYWYSTRSDYAAQNTQALPSVAGSGWNVWVGHHLTRHLDVQVGMFFHSSSVAGNISFYNQQLNDTLAYRETRYVRNRPFYLPATIKFTPLGNHRRIQPYLLAGVSMAIGRIQKNTMQYDPSISISEPPVYNRTSEKEGYKAMFGAYLGLGLQVRIVNRVSLSLDGGFGKNLSRYGGVVANGGLGVIYDFSSAK